MMTMQFLLFSAVLSLMLQASDAQSKCVLQCQKGNELIDGSETCYDVALGSVCGDGGAGVCVDLATFGSPQPLLDCDDPNEALCRCHTGGGGSPNPPPSPSPIFPELPFKYPFTDDEFCYGLCVDPVFPVYYGEGNGGGKLRRRLQQQQDSLDDIDGCFYKPKGSSCFVPGTERKERGTCIRGEGSDRYCSFCDCIPGEPSIVDDPHVTTFDASHKFDYFGWCDVWVLQNPNFRNNLGMYIQMRTVPWSGPGRQTRSAASNMSVRIGHDVFEVQGPRDDIKIWLNGQEWNVDNAPENLAIDDGKFPIALHEVNDIRFHFKIRLLAASDDDNEEIDDGNHILIEVHKEFVNVYLRNFNPHQDYVGALGMLGRFPDGETVGRDGVTVIDDPLDLGQEWQVKEDEETLFHEQTPPNGPKAPQQCDVTLRLARGD